MGDHDAASSEITSLGRVDITYGSLTKPRTRVLTVSVQSI